MVLSAAQAIWFLPFLIPICMYVAWNDMKFMRIPNKTVLLTVGVFAVVGLIALPLGEYGIRWLHLLIVLLIGFVISSAGLVGAGDAKFAAAMAPFVPSADAYLFIIMFVAVMIGAWVTHRVAGRVGLVRAAAPDWRSWELKREFPMGLALGSTLVFYYLLPFLNLP